MISVLLLQQQVKGQIVSISAVDKPQQNGHFAEIDPTGKGKIYFIGNLSCPGATKPSTRIYTVFKNGVSQSSLVKSCTWVGNGCAITDTISITPDSLKFFKITLSFNAGASSYTADSILVGLTFLSCGQSNNVASTNQTQTFIVSQKDIFIRGWGMQGISNPVNPTYDKICYLANPDNYGTMGSVGYVNFNLAKLLKDSLHLPICIINGAVSGTVISTHQRNDALPTDNTTIYGRMLLRYKGSKFKKPLFLVWHQGETDAANHMTRSTYLNWFNQLKADWAQDYGSSTPIIVVQIGDSPCGASALEAVRIQNLQRKLGNIQVPISGITPRNNAHCHFRTLGYNEIGERIYKAWSGIDFPKPIWSTTRYGVKIVMSKAMNPSCVNKFHFAGSLLYSSAWITPNSVTVSGDTLKFDFFGTPIDSIAYTGFSWNGDTTHNFLRDIDGNAAFAFFVPVSGVPLMLKTMPNLEDVDAKELWEPLICFPNPATDEVIIEGDEKGESPVMLSDISGKVVANYPPGTKKIEIGRLPPGFYTIKIGSYSPAKFIKI